MMVSNGSHNALGDCGVRASAKQLTKMRVKNSKSAPISQVACKPWLGRVGNATSESINDYRLPIPRSDATQSQCRAWLSVD